jgi:hypothetical protein
LLGKFAYHNRRHNAPSALDSQQVTRVSGGCYFRNSLLPSKNADDETPKTLFKSVHKKTKNRPLLMPDFHRIKTLNNESFNKIVSAIPPDPKVMLIHAQTLQPVDMLERKFKKTHPRSIGFNDHLSAILRHA